MLLNIFVSEFSDDQPKDYGQINIKQNYVKDINYVAENRAPHRMQFRAIK